MSHKSAPLTVSTIGIDLGKNSFHLVGLDQLQSAKSKTLRPATRVPMQNAGHAPARWNQPKRAHAPPPGMRRNDGSVRPLYPQIYPSGGGLRQLMLACLQYGTLSKLSPSMTCPRAGSLFAVWDP
jgi:hypothetical protein